MNHLHVDSLDYAFYFILLFFFFAINLCCSYVIFVPCAIFFLFFTFDEHCAISGQMNLSVRRDT